MSITMTPDSTGVEPTRSGAEVPLFPEQQKIQHRTHRDRATTYRPSADASGTAQP